MTDRPLISVIIPCWQAEATIGRAVKTVFDQLFDECEIILINDGSTDGTEDVLTTLQSFDPRVRVINQEKNMGVSAARNAGIQQAKGKWLFFLDSDDYLLPGAFDKLLLAEEEPLDIICASYLIHYTDTKRYEVQTCADGDKNSIFESLIRGDSALNSMCARLYRTEMIIEKRIEVPETLSIGEDVLFNMKAFFYAKQWKIIREPIYCYELGGDSAMTRAVDERFEKSLPMIRKIDLFLRQNNMKTDMFRAMIDIYVRTLRVESGRINAALRLSYKNVNELCRGVEFLKLPIKQKLYYLALRIAPFSSVLLP